MKFGVGQPVRRFEDQTLITGKGRYTDDLHFDKAAQAYVVRARVAHANIRRIDTAAARGMPSGKDGICDRMLIGGNYNA